MSLKFLSPIDLTQNEIQNAVAQNLGTAPSDAVAGQFYFNSTNGIKRLRVFNGSTWDIVGVGDGSVLSVSGSGGTTGLTLTGGAITGTGTLTLGGTLAIANGGTGNTTAITGLAALGGVASSLLGQASGVATLDTGGKVPISQLPGAVLGNLQYQGVWDADTNTPTLANGTGNKGAYYKVTTAGASFGKVWTAGDLIIYNGSVWDQVQGGTSDVISVAGQVGVVTLAGMGLGNVTNTSDANKPVSTAQQTALDLKATIASPTFTGVPAAPTATAGTSTTQLATTAFVAAFTGTTNLVTLGTVTAGTWNGTTVAVLNGGTGATTAAGAKTALGFTTKFATDFGDGTTTSFSIAHGLGTIDIVVRFFVAATGQTVELDYSNTASLITFTLPVAPTSNQYRLVAVG